MVITQASQGTIADPAQDQERETYLIICRHHAAGLAESLKNDVLYSARPPFLRDDVLHTASNRRTASTASRPRSSCPIKSPVLAKDTTPISGAHQLPK